MGFEIYHFSFGSGRLKFALKRLVTPTHFRPFSCVVFFLQNFLSESPRIPTTFILWICFAAGTSFQIAPLPSSRSVAPHPHPCRTLARSAPAAHAFPVGSRLPTALRDGRLLVPPSGPDLRLMPLRDVEEEYACLETQTDRGHHDRVP